MSCDVFNCDCTCHDGLVVNEDRPALVHPGVTCADHVERLDADVLVQLTSWQNVTYRHVVSTRLTRREWLDADAADRAEAINDAVLRSVEATVLDEPVDVPEPYELGD